MKVKELSFLLIKDLQKLCDVVEMDVADFLCLIEEKKNHGAYIKKPYLALYDTIKANWEQIQHPTIDPIEVSLEPIPIDELKFHFPSDVNAVDKLKSGGIVNLGQLYGTPIQDIEMLRNIGSTALFKIQSMKEALAQNPNVFIGAWLDSQTTHELPSNYDRSLGLETNLRNAMVEYATVIETNVNNRRYIDSSQQKKSYSLLAYILKQYYSENHKSEKIAEKVGYTPEHIEILRNKCLTEIISGLVFFKNYKLNQNLLDLLQSLEDECLFDPIEKFEIYSGSSDTKFFNDLGYDTLKIKDVAFLVPRYTVGKYNKVWKIIYETLLENILPTDKDVIYQLVIDNKDLANVEYDTNFIDKILVCDKFVEDKGKHSIQIRKEYLSTDAQRFARIIYEADHKLTTKEVRSQYEALYQNTPTAGPNTAGKYGICCEGRRLWYYGQPKTLLQQRISEYAENKKVFFYQDLKQKLEEEGYTIPQAIRVYITNVCLVDNKDKDHFCHKDYVDDYPDCSWRNPKKYGWTNWVFNEIRDILLERGSVPLQEMIDELEKRSQETDFNSMRQRIQYNIMAGYFGEDKPFVIVEGNVVINRPVYDATEFETIGLRGVKHAYYKQIRSLVANEVKKAESGKKKLVDIIQLVNETVVDDEPLSRGVIIRAIKDEQHRFAPIDVELINEDGIMYVQWTKQVIVPEPVYVVSTDDNATEDDRIIELEHIDSRPNIKYRQSINWPDLVNTLKHELAFFGRWMQFEHYEINESIDLFVYLITHSKNSELYSQLPLDLYEYWFACTDAHDRYRYLKDIILDFEAILGDLYYYRYGKEPNTKGLAERATYFEGLPNMLLYSRDNKGFSRIACTLLHYRNIIAHGGSLDLSSMETAKSIVEFVALFVYVVARYYHK